MLTKTIKGYTVVRYDSNNFLTDGTLEEIIKLIEEKTNSSMNFKGVLEQLSELENIQDKNVHDCYFIKKDIDNILNTFIIYLGKTADEQDNWLVLSRDMQIYKTSEIINMVDNLFL